MPDEASRLARLEVRADRLERVSDETARAVDILRQENAALHELATLSTERTLGLRKDLDDWLRAMAEERTERRRESFTTRWQRATLWATMTVCIIGQTITVLVATGVIG